MPVALSGNLQPALGRPARITTPRTQKHVFRSCVRTKAAIQDKQTAQTGLLRWLEENAASQEKVDIRTVDLQGQSRPLDVTVAKQHVEAGEVIISIPENLVVTLSRVFEDDTVAELLTYNKLSELACLTVYMMYEKKIGKESFWYDFIKELDKQRARGPQAVESPLLWSTEELEDLLQGSPVVAATKQRLADIEREYNELDTVWYMAGSLFVKYPFDPPQETFSFALFKQAFAAIQASVVHLQGVSLAKRFALVPLGPPLLSYSSTCKALVTFNRATRAVELVADRSYEAGAPVYAWCGPQPNSRLLINYGIVDETNPYDKLQVTVTISKSDPLFQAKRNVLHARSMSTQQTFDFQRGKPLPPTLIPFLRVGYAMDEAQLGRVSLEEGAVASDPVLEQRVLSQLAAYLEYRIAQYKHPLWKDMETLTDPASTPRQKIAARMTKIEKSILMTMLEEVQALSGGETLPGITEQLPAYIANLLETGKEPNSHCG